GLLGQDVDGLLVPGDGVGPVGGDVRLARQLGQVPAVFSAQTLVLDVVSGDPLLGVLVDPAGGAGPGGDVLTDRGGLVWFLERLRAHGQVARVVAQPVADGRGAVLAERGGVAPDVDAADRGQVRLLGGQRVGIDSA